MEERRRFTRWQIGKQARLKVDGNDAPVDCYIADVSLKGLQLRSPRQLEQGIPIKLNIAISYEFMLNVEASVAWHRVSNEDNIYGISFTRIRDADKEGIYRFVHNNFPEQLTQQWWKEPTKAA